MEWSGPLFQRSAKYLLDFLTPVVAELGRSERRVAATRYVQGLLLPGQRKSVEPMAQRLGVEPQGLQQFISASPWSDQAVWTVVRQQIIPHLEPMETWVVDETGWRTTCQTAWSLHGLSLTNCCSPCGSTPSRSAIGSTDLRCPGMSSPCT